MKAKVFVTLKRGVLDPQGKAVAHGLQSLGFAGVEDVRIGKYLELTLGAGPREDAERRVREMCEKLLANTVIEDFRFEIEEGSAS